MLRTSESVSAGHPDKIADQISDAVLDAILERDPEARVAVETLVSHDMTVVAGEVTTAGYVSPIVPFVKEFVRTPNIIVSIRRQSPDIAQAVDGGGAGDQGMVIGYATDETPELMPLPITLAHSITRRMGRIDGKAQVTVEYDGENRPVRLHTLVVSVQHAKYLSLEAARKFIRGNLVDPELARFRHLVDADTRILINPGGKFTVGGPDADTGLTGRKVVVDTYGGAVPHGGGAFSGKDPTKMDRSAAYMARYVAKNLVAAGLASRAQVTLAYAIGLADPIEVSVDTFGTGQLSDERLNDLVRDHFKLTPSGIIETLDLRRPIYLATASGGHFGNGAFPWERLDKVNELR